MVSDPELLLWVSHIAADSHGLWLGTSAGLMKFADGQVFGDVIPEVAVKGVHVECDSRRCASEKLVHTSGYA